MTDKVRLHEAETADIWELYHRLPFLKISRNVMESIVLRSPLHVKLSKDRPMMPELRILFDLYWTKWDIDKFDWENCFGVVPWFPVNIRGTIHRYPVVPKFGSGFISTFLDKDGIQHFSWNWTVGPKLGEDKSFYFEVKSNPPDLSGHYTSPIASLLLDWKTTRVVREAIEIASYQQARVQHIFEYRPPKNIQGDTDLTTLEEFGDTISATVMSQQEGLKNAKMVLNSEELQRAISTANAKNRGIRAKFGGTGFFLKSESADQKWERENANILDKSIPLPADYAYKPAQSPHIQANLIELSNRLDHMASALMDVPIALVEGMGKTTANVQGNFRILNERIKDWQEYRRRTTKKALLILYGEHIQEDLNYRARLIRSERPDVILNLYADSELEVEVDHTPVATAADLQNLNLAKYMDKKVVAKHLFNVLGLPESDISVKPDPPMEMGGGGPSPAKKMKPVTF